MKKKTTQIVELASKKSQSALEVFTSTIEALKQANDELASARQADLELIGQVQSNVLRANKQEEQNNKLIDRINNIID